MKKFEKKKSAQRRFSILPPRCGFEVLRVKLLVSRNDREQIILLAQDYHFISLVVFCPYCLPVLKSYRVKRL